MHGFKKDTQYLIQLHVCKTTKPLRCAFKGERQSAELGHHSRCTRGTGRQQWPHGETEKAKRGVPSFQKLTSSEVQRLTRWRTQQNSTCPNEKWPRCVEYIGETGKSAGAAEAALHKGQWQTQRTCEGRRKDGGDGDARPLPHSRGVYPMGHQWQFKASVTETSSICLYFRNGGRLKGASKVKQLDLRKWTGVEPLAWELRPKRRQSEYSRQGNSQRRPGDNKNVTPETMRS